MTFYTKTLTAMLMLGVSTVAARAEDLVIYQNWSSPAEVAALNVLKTAVTAKGINWIDITIPHDTGSSVSLLNLVVGEQAPNIFSENNTGVYRDLTGMNLGRDLTEAFTQSGAIDHFSPAVKKGHQHRRRNPQNPIGCAHRWYAVLQHGGCSKSRC